MALVGVISTETDQAVFPFGKANSIAGVIVAYLWPGWQPEFHSGIPDSGPCPGRVKGTGPFSGQGIP
jgi:hypothetical protein